MFTEDYCSKEVRNLLVTKGFIGDMWYNNDDIHISHALAMKWLREKGIVIQISPILQDQPFGLHYRPSVQDYQRYMRHDNFDEFNTYEEAVEAALKYVLENLV